MVEVKCPKCKEAVMADSRNKIEEHNSKNVNSDKLCAGSGITYLTGSPLYPYSPVESESSCVYGRR